MEDFKKAAELLKKEYDAYWRGGLSLNEDEDLFLERQWLRARDLLDKFEFPWIDGRNKKVELSIALYLLDKEKIKKVNAMINNKAFW